MTNATMANGTSSAPITRYREADDQHEQRGKHGDLSDDAEPERSRKAPFQRRYDAVEVGLGEYHDAEPDDGEQGEPGDDEFDRLPGRQRLTSWPRAERKGRACQNDRSLLAFNRSAVDDQAASNRPGVARHPSAWVNADVAIQGEHVANDGAVDIEIATCDGDGAVDHGARRDRAVAECEDVGVGQVGLAGASFGAQFPATAFRCLSPVVAGR